MASLLSRFTTFVPNTTILSNDHNQELNRIVNLLNGTTTNLKTVLKTSDAGDPPLELDQLSTGPIQEWYQGGVLKASITNDGSLSTLGAAVTISNAVPVLRLTDTSSSKTYVETVDGSGNMVIGEESISNAIAIAHTTGKVTFEEIPLGPAADPTTDNELPRKLYVDSKKVSFSASFFILDPSTAATGSLDFGELIIPAGGTFTVTKCKVARVGGSHTAGGSVTFIVQQQGVGTKATLVLDDTNSAVNTVYTDDIGDFTLAENQLIGVLISAQSGTISERNVTVTIEGHRTVF